MKREQLEGKFIICRTQDEFKFIRYWANVLFSYDIDLSAQSLPFTIRIKDGWGWNEVGDYEIDSSYGCEKEEECSVLFGNLVRRWAHENRTWNGNSLS